MSVELIQSAPSKARGRKASPITAWLHSIKRSPGEWFQYPERVNAGTAAAIKQGRYADINGGEFDAVSRDCSPDSQATVYACYMPRPDRQPSQAAKHMVTMAQLAQFAKQIGADQ